MTGFEELFCMEVTPLPAVLVIFGGTGDLAGRKLFPALAHLDARELLHESTVVIACGRRSYTTEQFRAYLRDKMQRDESLSAESLERTLQRIFYHCGDNHDVDSYRRLKETLANLEQQNQSGFPYNHLFYLALGSAEYVVCAGLLAQEGLLTEHSESEPWRHVIVEKPFGSDYESALHLDHALHHALREEQIYRIDHYLGKEAVQNIMMLRFANIMFEPVWRAEYIERVEITVAETLSVGTRAAYYESAGALRDMVQNHLLQLLSLIAMEPPSSFEADAVRDEKVKVLRSLRRLTEDTLSSSVVRAQYTENKDTQTPGYRQSPGVAADSPRETFVAMKIFVDNFRWRGVPFFLRTGKCLSSNRSEIVIHFKRLPHSIFPYLKPEDLAPDRLILELRPETKMVLELQAKKPGPKLCLGTMQLRFDYQSISPQEQLDDAYERLLLDALLGDASLFIRSDFILEAWKFLKPLLGHLDSSNDPLLPLGFYRAGAATLEEADRLAQESGHEWRTLGD